MNLFPNRYFDPNKPFNAKFGRVGLIGSWWNKGFLVGRYKRLTQRKSFENVILSAPTGAGKTTRFLVKQLLSLKNCSLLINDPQGELWQYCSGYLSLFAQVYSINFSNSAKSAGFNPFARLKRANDVNKIAHLLISHTLDKGNGDVFWSLASTNLISTLLRLLLYQPKEYRNLANLIRLVQYFELSQKVDEWIAKTQDEKLILDYKSIISTPEKTLQNVVASVKAALQVFDDPEIARTTAYDTINFEDLRRTPTAIFLHNSLGDSRYISILNSIFFEQFYAFALETLPSKQDLSIYVILEECASMYIPMLAQATATCRKARVGNFLTVQAHSQLKSFYKGEAETIKSNCRCKIWLTGQTSLDELREIEILSGKRIHTDGKVVPLISADAIRMLPENRSLILSGNTPLILGKTSSFYRSLLFRHRAGIPPQEFEKHIPDESIPMLK